MLGVTGVLSNNPIWLLVSDVIMLALLTGIILKILQYQFTRRQWYWMRLVALFFFVFVCQTFLVVLSFMIGLRTGQDWLVALARSVPAGLVVSSSYLITYCLRSKVREHYYP